jgi:hypothetical protein
MGKLLRHRRLVGGRPDRIAVRRHYAHCRKTDRPRRGSSRRRLRDAERRSFRTRAVAVGDCERSLGRHRPCRRPLGRRGSLWGRVHRRRGPSDACAEHLPARVRGLVIPCPAAPCGICRPGDLGVRGTVLRAPSPFPCWCGGNGIALDWNSQCVGRDYIHGLCPIQARRVAWVGALGSGLKGGEHGISPNDRVHAARPFRPSVETRSVGRRASPRRGTRQRPG